LIDARAARNALVGQASGLVAVATLTWLYVRVLHISDATTAALTYLVLLLFVAAWCPLWVAIATTVAASLALDFFFFPPVGTLNIDDPEDWMALGCFLVASLVASQLSSLARHRHAQALQRQNEIGRLFELSRDILLVTEDSHSLRSLAELINTRFLFEYVAISLRTETAVERYEAGTRDAPQPMVSVELTMQRGSPITGSLTVAGRGIETATLDGVAGVVAIAVERIHLLAARREAELAQRSLELKAMLMASLAHDLGTPLTAIRLAVENLNTTQLSDTQRLGQANVALHAVDRLARLFRNMLEMTRIDAGHVAPQLQWVSPAELVEAARSQAADTLSAHPIDVVDLSGDRIVRVDARLTSAALAHVIENAAQYSPRGSTIVITHQLTAEGLRISVKDQGPGIAAADAPHLFERLYRGSAAKARGSGTGMGLAIARGLLTAEGGRIWIDNCPEGGAEISIGVPSETRPLDQPSEDAGMPPQPHPAG
jgi:two-component system sensor histidine kinase KdpD